MTLRERRAVFRVWVERHHQALYRTALRALGDQEAAADVVQETYAKAWGYLVRDDPSVANPRAWLYELLRYRILEAYRDRGRMRRHSETTVFEPPSDTTPDAEIERKERKTLLRRCLALLSAVDRTVLQLRATAVEVPEIPELGRKPTFGEIAQVMSEGSRTYTEDGIRMRAKRAFKKLRNCVVRFLG